MVTAREAQQCEGHRLNSALTLTLLLVLTSAVLGQDVTYVATRDQWVIASQSNPAHIVITAHLDLSVRSSDWSAPELIACPQAWLSNLCIVT